MKFSVIMPSYLGKYKNQAKDVDKKIVRAIDSVINQTFTDWELIVVSDGCDKTDKIVSNITDSRVRGLRINKQGMFSGTPRNVGIKYAKGEYIIYLDVDDTFGENHLQIVHDQITDYDWYWFDDRSWDSGTNKFEIHRVGIDTSGSAGTSNICHRRDLDVWWTDKLTYLHDFMFIVALKQKTKNFTYLEQVPEYQICHVPKLLDV